MANLANEKLNNINKLLSERHLKVTSNIKDDLKCGICKNILIDAQLTECGCNFCKRCIDEHKNSGGTCCPGKSVECKNTGLLNVLVDSKINWQVSRLRVRCDINNCDFECELINIEAHFGICPKQKLNCPFNIVGCKEMLGGDKMNDHLQMDSYNHNKLLLEMINNLRNEINELRDNERRNKCDIARILDDRERNSNDIIILKDMIEKKTDCEIIEKDKKDLKKEIRQFKDKLDENEKRFEEMIKMIEENNDNCNKEIINIKENVMKNDYLERKIDSLQMEVKDGEERLNSTKLTIQKSENEKLELIKDIKLTKTEIKKVFERADSVATNNLKLEKEIKELKEMNVKRDEIIGLMKKEIGFLNENMTKVDKIKENCENKMKEMMVFANQKCTIKDVELLINENIKKIETQMNEWTKNVDRETIERVIRLEKDFYQRCAVFVWNIGQLDKWVVNQCMESECFYYGYNLYKMRLHLSFGAQFGNNFCIKLLIYKGENDSRIKWPFKANVTIEITDKIDRDIRKGITKICVIERPLAHVKYNDSDFFKFPRSDLSSIGLLNCANCTIECFIDYNK